jgi:copper chaperone CopZ
MERKTFEVPNISCQHCVMTIKREVGDLAGVTDVEADADTKQVTVAWESPANWGEIKDLLQEINYPPKE